MADENRFAVSPDGRVVKLAAGAPLKPGWKLVDGAQATRRTVTVPAVTQEKEPPRRARRMFGGGEEPSE